MNLNANERKVLGVLGGAREWWYFSFAYIADETDLDRKEVRRACRSLKRKGLAEFKSGLWSEDGKPAGSGYGATAKGRHWFWNAAA